MENLLTEGLSLMGFGLGFVFVFLTLLVFATSLMSKFVTKFIPEPVVLPRAKPAAPVAAGQNKDELLAVLSAAMHHHRSK